MSTITHSTHASSEQVPVRQIQFSDLLDSISKGIDDFRAKPTHLLFLAVIYPLATLGAALVMAQEGLLPVIYPVISSFFLIGPIVALGMYEFSRRRERGENTTWRQGFNFLKSPAIGEIAVLGIMLIAVFLLWLTAAMTIYESTIAMDHPHTVVQFVNDLLTTPAGWTMIVVGNVVGLFFALKAFAIGVISFPLLLDRHVSVGVAVSASIRAVVNNPLIMLTWGAVIVGSLLIGAVPLLVGIAIVFPVLGHATWHLYRKVVV